MISIAMKLARLPLALALLALVDCASSAPAEHGTITPLTISASDLTLCEHRVPAETCARCHPELAEKFKAANDWCAEHDVPESQCLICHPDLTFEPLPALPATADVGTVSNQGEDVPDLAPHAALGKATIFDFYADWCAPCRKIDLHVFGLLKDRADLALRKLNVVSWETPLAKRYLKDVESLPYLMVYDRKGKLIKTISGLDLAALDAAITEASKP
jgi:thiol-disulfide isomerase/thioredoxin